MQFLNPTDLPPAPEGRAGWPWTCGSTALPEQMPDGRPWPKISIITPSFNQGTFIEETIRSVLLQNYPHLEYLVFDAESSDQTLAVIEKYRPWISFIEIKKDRGQAHAINKGFEKCSGAIVQWINTDDVLLPNALATVAQKCRADGAFAGSVEIFGANLPDVSITNRNLTVPGLASDDFRFIQPGLWLGRSAANSCFPLDETLHYAFDWKMLWLLCRSGCSIEHSPIPLVRFRRHPGSKTIAFSDRWHDEGMKTWSFLLEDDRFASLRPFLQERMNRQKIHRQIELAEHSGKKRLAFTLVRIIARQPKYLFDRFLLGSVRQKLLGILKKLD